MKRERLTRHEREERVRTFVEGVIARRGELPTVVEVVEAVGGSTLTVAAVLREYRRPHASRRDERRIASERT